MVVIGLMRGVTAESSERVALGGGAVVMDVLSQDDGRSTYEKINRLRQLRPDMILVAGGTDGGNVQHVTELAEIVALAEPSSRLGDRFKLPVIFAGNKDARNNVNRLLSDIFDLTVVDNIRPTMEEENSAPARAAIQLLFMNHVMSHAPGYDKLMQWTDIDIMPTPMAEGTMMSKFAEQKGMNLIGVGLGGATTNVYSVFSGRFVRTVSANLGMSYSICNVLRETSIENILRWIPFEIEVSLLDNILGNKMIRPTTIPCTIDELMIEHAVAREALRLGLIHHKILARGLRGTTKQRELGRIFEQTLDSESYIDLMKVSLICGTGGLLSRAPNRSQAAMILIDGFQPEGVTEIVVDSVFMIPHLGVLSTVHPKAAIEVFEKDCIIKLGTCIAPRGQNTIGTELMRVEGVTSDGTEISKRCMMGDISVIPLPLNEQLELTITPRHTADVGMGPGKKMVSTVEGGVVGVILDTRGRPIVYPQGLVERKKKLYAWYNELKLYPEEELERYIQEGVI